MFDTDTVSFADYDVLIASHAIALGVTLVTNSIRHFKRVRGLKTVNWL